MTTGLRVNNLKIQNLIGIRDLDAECDDITLFAGLNWQGKTTIQQAVCLAICKELPRVRLKNQAAYLVNDTSGKQGAQVSVDTSIGTFQASISKAGKLSFNEGPDRDAVAAPLRLILSPRLFGSLDATERRAALCAAFKIEATVERVTSALRAHNIPEAQIEDITPLLAGGSFDAAAQEAESRCKEYRAAWKALTGEAYGPDKAESWEAPPNEIDPKAATSALERAKRLEAVADKELTDFAAKVQTKRVELEKAKHEWVCKHCGVVNEANVELASEINALLPEMENSLQFLERAKATRVRDRIAAEQMMQEATTQESGREKKTADALREHERVRLWTQIKQLMSPDGIPAALIADVLKGLNTRMRETATITGWPQVALANDMTLTVGNRLYELASEAEMWTADATLCEALAALTGIKVLVLDRADVLGIDQRNNLLVWCDALAQEGTQVILFATLKGPASLEGIRCYWIHHGELQAVAEAA